MRRGSILVLGLVVLVGVAAWLLDRGGHFDGRSLTRAKGQVPELGAPSPLDMPTEGSAPARLDGLAPAAEPTEAATTHRISGTVFDPQGEVVSRAWVELVQWELVDAPGLPGQRISRSNDVGKGRTDLRGGFAFDGLAAGRYAVHLLAPPGWLASSAGVEVLRADVEVDLHYRSPVEATVTVVDEDGQGIEGCSVRLHHARHGSGIAGVRTGEGGTARLRGLDPTWRADLIVSAPRAANLFEHVEEAWEAADTRIVLSRMLQIRGRVVDENGQPFPDASVRYQRPVDDGSRILSAAVISAGADGRFVISRLEHGVYEVLALAPGRYASDDAAPVAVPAGTGDLELVVTRGVDLEIRVTGWPVGRKGDGCAVDVANPRERRYADVSKEGLVAFRGLDPGRDYAVWITVPRDERFAYHPALRATEGSTELALQKGQPILVSVKAPEGIGVRDVSAGDGPVQRRGRPLLETASREDVAGTWRIPSLPPGVWTVSAVGSKTVFAGTNILPKLTHHGQVRASPGEEVELVLEVAEAD